MHLPKYVLFFLPKDVFPGLGPLREASLVALASLLEGFWYGFGCTVRRLGMAVVF